MGEKKESLGDHLVTADHFGLEDRFGMADLSDMALAVRFLAVF
jgi:hypothetical protein